MFVENILEAGEYGNPVLFNWSLIDECQFKCSYCYSTDFNKQNNFKKGLYRKSHLLVLNKLKKINFDWTIDLQGGEPTLHPDLFDIIQSLNSMDKCKEIVLATNLTKGVQYYKKLDILNSKLSIHVSYHAEYHKKIFKRICDLYNSLENIDFFVEVILYPKKQYFEQTLNLLENLEFHKIPFDVNLVYKNEFWDGITDDGFYELFNPWLNSTKKFSKNVKHVTTNGVEYLSEIDILRNNISYKDFSCQALAYTIDINGDISNTCTNKKLQLVIKEEDVKKTVICPKKTCACTAMFHYKKNKITNIYEKIHIKKK